MSFSKPSLVSPVEVYIQTNAREGKFKTFSNVDQKKTVSETPLRAIILESRAAEYTGYNPGGDHYSSNHFKTDDPKAWVTIRRVKSGIALEGNPQDQAFKAKVTAMKPGIKYAKLIFLRTEDGQLGVLRLTGTVLNSFIEATKGVNVDHNPVMTVTVGQQYEANSQLIYKFNFQFEPLTNQDQSFVDECVEMDKTVQTWLTSKQRKRNAEPEEAVAADMENLVSVSNDQKVEDDF